jgi:hypothetical protein
VKIVTQYSEFSQEKQLCLNLLAEGRLNKSEIANVLGINRGSIYNWMKDPEFIAELDRRKQLILNFADKMITSKLDAAIEEYWEMRNTTTNEKVKSDIYQYFIDRSMGKATSKHQIEASMKQPDTIDEDVLESEFEAWDSEDEK